MYRVLNKLKSYGLIGLYLLGSLPCVADSDNEARIRAAFIYNFTKFVEWPTPPQASFKILIIGADDLVEPLNEFKSKGKLFQNKVVEVTYSEKTVLKNDIQILILDLVDEKEFKQALKLYSSSPALIVNTKSNLAKKGAMISFIKKADDTLGFGINLTKVNAQKLKMSSQLTKLGELETETP